MFPEDAEYAYLYITQFNNILKLEAKTLRAIIYIILKEKES